MLKEIEKRARIAEQEWQARITQVIEEFGGADVALERMAAELLHCRWTLQKFLEAADLVRSDTPFIIMPAGPLWSPPPPAQRRWWVRQTDDEETAA